MPTDPPLGEPVTFTGARLPEPATLSGRFGLVERLNTKKHGTQLWRALAGHDEIFAYMPYGPFADEKEFLAFLDEKLAERDPYLYAIVDLYGACVGYFALMAIRPDMGVIEVGHVVYAPPLQRTPLATEAQYLLMRYVFEELGYRRYEWKCNSLNEKSKKAAIRFGFTYEGTFRQHMITKGTNRDTAWYSMLDKDWPAIKKRFETWLLPENFDEAGWQKTALKHR